MAEGGGPRPSKKYMLMGDTAPLKIQNYVTALEAGRIAPIEMIFRVR